MRIFLPCSPIALAACCAAALISCSAKPSPVTPPAFANPVTLKLSHPWAAETDGNTIAFRQVLGEYSRAYPGIRLEVDAVAQSYDQKLKTLLAAGEAPDIFMSWGGGFSRPIVDSGVALALDAYLLDGTRDRILPGMLENFTYDKQVYALPTTLAVGTLFCNRELFEKLGVPLPESFDDLLTAAAVFNRKGIIPLIGGGKDLWPLMFYYDILALRTAGIRTCKEALNSVASFDQPGFIDAAARLQQLVRAGVFNANAVRLSWDEAVATFTRGTVAMLYNATWVGGVIESPDSGVKGKIVARAFPLITGGKGTANEFMGGAVDCLMVSAKSSARAEAVQSVKFLAEHMARDSYSSGSGIPAWKVDGVDATHVSPLLLQQVAMVGKAAGFLEWWDTYLGGDAATTHKNLVVQLFDLRISPQQFARSMQQLNVGK